MENQQDWENFLKSVKNTPEIEKEIQETLEKANLMLTTVKSLQEVNQKLTAVFLELYDKPELKSLLDDLLKKHGMSITPDSKL